MSNVKYNHIRDNSLNGGYTLGWVEVENTLFVAIANCSDKDRFVKSIGREIVDGRLEVAQKGFEGKYFSSISLAELKEFLTTNSEQLFGVLNKNSAVEAIARTSFKDLNYNVLTYLAGVKLLK
jgi:hypothetical protein